MRPLPFSLRQLQYVISVADTQGFRRAAEACRVAQPSLSAQVAEVEQGLGVQIFERGRRVRLTKAGAALLPRMRDVLAHADELAQAARGLPGPFEGELRFGVIPTVASYVLPSFTPALAEAHPRLRVLWVEDKTATLVQMIERGELDAAVLALEADTGALDHVEIARDPFVLAGPATHALLRARAPMRGLTALADEPLHLLDEGHCFRDQARDLCSRAGVREATFRATSLATLVQVVRSTGGLTLLPQLALAVENRGVQLAVRRFVSPGPSRTLALAFRRTSPLADSLRTLTAILRRAYPRVPLR